MTTNGEQSVMIILVPMKPTSYVECLTSLTELCVMQDMEDWDEEQVTTSKLNEKP